MNKFNIYLTVLVVFATFQTAFSQVKDENIGAEVVTIVKPYTPTISDAFKVKEIPVLADEELQTKVPIQYTIFSFPVASTFTPSKGKAAGVDKAVKEKQYDNYATLGFGNYPTINAELFLNKKVSSTKYVGGMLRHLSSQGGIKGLQLDDKYAVSSLDLTYGSRERDKNWRLDLALKNQINNWYGLPDYSMFDETFVNTIDSKQSYTSFGIGGTMSLKNGLFNELSGQYKRFSDAFGSGENRFFVQPNFDLKVMDQKIKAGFVVDYVGGNFERRFDLINSAFAYSTLNFGFSPSILYQQSELSVQIGARVFYSIFKTNGIAMPADKNSIFIYPNVKASYKVVGDILIAYAGAEGGLQQNSYADFVNENPFVSPTLLVAPTDNKFDIYAGLKGKLASTVAFNVRASYKNEGNKALFLNNKFVETSTNTEGYAYGNSFGVVYDQVKTVGLFGELKADFSKRIAFGINGTLNSYSTDTQAEAWNLPQLKVGSSIDVVVTSKWFAGAALFFVGERNDFVAVQSDIISPVLFENKVHVLDSYFDLNAHVSYKYNARLSAFLKGNNLANQQYNRWANFPVQGIQVLLGANYKFDF